tara:strand:+ start:555 stop:1226 length:672 start_codon:yes stop_codon:yes gene_type:complete
MKNDNILFIDFDSTFIKLETLDELAKFVLKDDKERDSKIKRISDITNLAMSGKINFTESLNLRLNLLEINKADINQITNYLSKKISNSINLNIDSIRSISQNIWIVSGGFMEIISPIVKNFNIKKDNILANEFIYDEYDKVIGCNEQNDLFKSNGKIRAIKNLKLSENKIMIGDGFTDYEVFKHGAVNTFIYYSENVLRYDVSKLSKYKASSFDDVLEILKNL